MKYAYVVRQPTSDSEISRWYCLKFIDPIHVHKGPTVKSTFKIEIGDAQPPVLRKRSNGESVWDYSNKPMSTPDFHKTYPHIRLKPGEGPILVDLDDVSTKRTSKHPED